MANDTREQLQAQIGDDYLLQWIIGHGGMSTVWLADDVVNEREVAIKVLRPEFSNNDEFLDRFRNEAKAAESIESDNVVATYDYREIPDPAGHTNCFIAMEYVRGESLADLLAREDKLEQEIALDVLEQAAHGLAKIHRMGLIHRDIKPGNLMITQNGQVKITDFGIAKAAAAVPLTRTGMVVGTAQYVSPEQAQGYEVTAATDVYSLGVVGYEMLAGERPFTGDSGVSVALAHVNNAPPALPTSVSAEARELVGIALRKDPGTRFADGNELQLAAAAVRAGHRPPQPASAAMNQLAEEPSPTASTHLLGQVAQPTTIHPATVGPTTARAARAAESVGPVAPVGPVPSRGNRPRKKGGGGFGLGLLLAAIIVVGGGLIVWALAQTGMFEGGSEPTPTETSEPTVVTEWVTPTEETTSTEPSTTELVTTTVAPPPEQPAPDPGTLSPPPVTTQAPNPNPNPSPDPGPEQPSPSPTPPPPTQDTPPPAETAPPPPASPTAPSPGTGAGSDPGDAPGTPGPADQLAEDLEQMLGGN